MAERGYRGRNNNAHVWTNENERPRVNSRNTNNVSDEVELSSQVLTIGTKRFYVDVKQNLRGKFVKISEVTPGNRKSRIIMTLPVASEMRVKLEKLLDFYNELPEFKEVEKDPNSRSKENRLASETISRESRRYYLDLKENHRGRILRATMLTSTQRSTILIPANGIRVLRETLVKLVEEFYKDSEGTDAEHGEDGGMESKVLRSFQKMFYFDVGNTRRGMFMRISEVRPTFRTAITIPDRQWVKVRDFMNEYVEKLETAKKSLKDAEERSDALKAKKEQAEDDEIVG